MDFRKGSGDLAYLFSLKVKINGELVLSKNDWAVYHTYFAATPLLIPFAPFEGRMDWSSPNEFIWLASYKGG